MSRNPTLYELTQVSLDPREFAGILQGKTIRGIRKMFLNEGPAVRLNFDDGMYCLRPEFWAGDRLLIAAPNIMGTNRPITNIIVSERQKTFSLFFKHEKDTLASFTTTNNTRGGTEEGPYPVGLYTVDSLVYGGKRA